jgi:hypothetical protein
LQQAVEAELLQQAEMLVAVPEQLASEEQVVVVLLPVFLEHQ